MTIDRFIVVRYGTLHHFVLIMNFRASKKMLFLLSYKTKESGFLQNLAFATSAYTRKSCTSVLCVTKNTFFLSTM